jgi:hypothetical protein
MNTQQNNLNWQRWTARLLLILVASGGTVTVTIGDVGSVQMQVEPVVARTG